LNLEKLSGKIDKADDEEVLALMYLLLHRVSASTTLIQDSDGIIRAHKMTFQSGDKAFSSSMKEFEWPLQPMPIPDALKGKIH